MNINRRSSQIVGFTLGLAFAGWVAALPALAAEQAACKGDDLANFTVISKANIDAVKGKCFGGHRVGDMIPERMEWMMREQGFSIKAALPEPKKFAIPYRLRMATEKYKGTSKIDPATKQLSGYVAGIPFPDLDLADPMAAYKLHYNHFYNRGGDHFGNTSPNANFSFTLIEGRSGIERIQDWNFSVYKLIGRVTGGDTHMVGDGSIFTKAILFAAAPFDVKGVGTFSIRYADGKMDDVWAYIRSVRRVRRLQGTAWVDPIGGTDELQDDFGLYGHPTWYDNEKLLGKVWAFGIDQTGADKPAAKRFPLVVEGKTNAEKYPLLKNEAPYWNVEDTWQPVENWIMEVTPPTYHPYSKRIIYFSADALRNNFSYAYDRKGDFWKVVYDGDGCYVTTDGFVDPDTGKPECVWYEQYGPSIDYQRRHATIYWVGSQLPMQPPGMKNDDFTYSILEAAGR